MVTMMVTMMVTVMVTVTVTVVVTVMVPRFPWGEESLLREDTDESLWFFGPAGHNKYRVAGVSWDFFIIDGGKN